MDRTIRIICQTLGVTEKEFNNTSKKATLVDARFIAMHICVDMELGTLEEIGFRCGDKNHATVIWAVKQSKQWVQYNSEYREKYEKCKARI